MPTKICTIVEFVLSSKFCSSKSIICIAHAHKTNRILLYRVNPITGCVENKPKVSPFEGMTEEQKEYEAMKLVNLINDLNNVGVIKPACVNEDGRTQPVEHVLQLRDELERVRGQQEEEEED